MAQVVTDATWTVPNEPGKTYSRIHIVFDEGEVAGDSVYQTIITPTAQLATTPKTYAEAYESALIVMGVTDVGQDSLTAQKAV